MRHVRCIERRRRAATRYGRDFRGLRGGGASVTAPTRFLPRTVASGFDDPVHCARQTFRVLLDAMAQPGRIFALPESVIEGLESNDPDLAPALSKALTSTLLTLLDADTAVHLAGALDTRAVLDYLCLHTGARPMRTGEPLGIAAARGADVDAALCARLAQAGAEMPQDGATLVVEVDALAEPPAGERRGVEVSGPATAPRRLAVAGLPAAFWDWRIGLPAAAPCTIDLLIVHDTAVAAIPRSAHLVRLD
jgi:alpha-D-ribose 1-methylphosphonate 5-triphosphate synthase subunit PhnH